jgi:hypothetical protein
MPVRKTRKRRNRRRNQRGGGDGCGEPGMIRLPPPYGCLYYDDPRMPAALESVDPFYAKQLHSRVIAAVFEFCRKRIGAGDDAITVAAKLRDQFLDKPWPAAIQTATQRIRQLLVDGQYDEYIAMQKAYRGYRRSFPPYAPMTSPSASALPSPIRSATPIERALEYSETAAADHIPPAGATKDALLTWIAAAKHADTHDPISLEPWADMTEAELRRTVRTQEGRVYTAESLEGILRAANEADTQPRDAYSRRPLTRRNLRTLRDVMRRTDPTYALPSRTQQRPPKHMAFSVAETADGLFYQLSLIDSRNGAELTDLGYVPAAIDAAISGSTDVTSAVAIGELQRAWDTGKFLASYKRPFECCRFHLGKPRSYWTSPGGTPVSRLAAMIAEIKSVF